MIGLKEMFLFLDETQKLHVQLGNGKEIQVEGKWTVQIVTNQGKWSLYNVQYVPELGYNLLFVGHLMTGGYVLLFDNSTCMIKNKKIEKIIVKILMA